MLEEETSNLYFDGHDDNGYAEIKLDFIMTANLKV